VTGEIVGFNARNGGIEVGSSNVLGRVFLSIDFNSFRRLEFRLRQG
jgi:hypothetical protein